MEEEQRRRHEERTNREQIIQDQQKDVDKLRAQVKHLQATRQEEQTRSEQIIQDQQKDLNELRGQIKYLQTSEVRQSNPLADVDVKRTQFPLTAVLFAFLRTLVTPIRQMMLYNETYDVSDRPSASISQSSGGGATEETRR